MKQPNNNKNSFTLTEDYSNRYKVDKEVAFEFAKSLVEEYEKELMNTERSVTIIFSDNHSNIKKVN